MFKLLARYLKAYIISAFAIISLLFVQANFDLMLPRFMSNIVDTGIQQSGIADSCLIAVSASTLDNLSLLLSNSQQQVVSDNYQLIAINDSRYLATYPLLKSQSIYLLGEKTDDRTLNEFWLQPLALYSLIVNNKLDLVVLNLAADTSIFSYLASLPSDQRESLVDQMYQQLKDSEPPILKQAAISVLVQEYDYLQYDLESKQQAYILKTGSQMLLLSAIIAVCAILVSLLSARTAAVVARNIRHDVFAKVESFSLAEFSKFSTASLITRTTNDITHIQGLITMSFRIVFYAPLLGIGALISVLNAEKSMVWIIGLGIVVISALAVAVFIFVIPKFKIVQKLIDRLNLVARENLTGLLVVRAFGSEDYEQQRFDSANQNLRKLQLFVNRAIVILMPLMHLIMSGLGILIVWFGAKQVDLGTMQVGSIMAFIQYTMQIIMSFVFIAAMFIMIPRASVSALRIMEVLDTPLTILDPEETREFDNNRTGEIVFNNVSFSYPDSEDFVLKDLSFSIPAGKTTAIIGSTGSGKSTLVNLILRLFDVSAGSITLASVDLRHIKQNLLRSKIGYISQTAVLFSGTIEENLKYGKADASNEQLAQAISIAQAEDLIQEKSAGYQEVLAQAATNLSGGQKQRLAIARALVKDADIYIFDDCFSALDYSTDAALRQALKNELSGKTLIIVTQRIATIRDADQIVVLEDGVIVGLGRHQDLLSSCAVYREIAYSQLSQQELQNE